MTEQTVQIIITLKVKENDLSFERPIDITNLEKDISSFSQEIGSQILSMMLKLLDDMLRNIVPDDWKNVGTEKRSVLFECGYVHFKRRIYQDSEGARHKPLDELLELEPWQRSSRALEEMGSALVATNTYRKASTLLSWLVKATISPSTIGRYLRKTGQRIQEQEGITLECEEQGQIETEVLYAEADGVYINLQGEEKKRAEVKVGIIYTGKEAIGKGRNRCMNKVCITQLGGSNEEWQLKMRDTIYHHYAFDNIKLLVAGGDGAVWVRNSFEYVGLPKVDLLDRYHVIRDIKWAWGKDMDIGSLLYELFTKGWHVVRRRLLANIARSKGDNKKKKLRTYKYLFNNRDGLLDLDQRGLPVKHFCTLGVAEGNVDKLVRQRMRGRGCSWSWSGARAMLAVLPHVHLLFQHVFEYRPVTVGKNKKQRIKKTEGLGYQPVSGSLSYLFSHTGQEKWVKYIKASLNSNLSLNEFF
jgi:hypothetical protein